MKLTPVEWLINMLPTINKDEPYYKAIIEQAKEMEKDEIKLAWYDIITKGDKNTAEQYYLERFNKTFKFK